MSYGYNVWGGWAGKTPTRVSVSTRVIPFMGGAKASSVRVPTDMIAIGDSNWDLDQKGDRDWSGFIGDACGTTVAIGSARQTRQHSFCRWSCGRASP